MPSRSCGCHLHLIAVIWCSLQYFKTTQSCLKLHTQYRLTSLIPALHFHSYSVHCLPCSISTSMYSRCPPLPDKSWYTVVISTGMEGQVERSPIILFWSGHTHTHIFLSMSLCCPWLDGRGERQYLRCSVEKGLAGRGDSCTVRHGKFVSSLTKHCCENSSFGADMKKVEVWGCRTGYLYTFLYCVEKMDLCGENNLVWGPQSNVAMKIPCLALL